ncbi:phage tail tube protein [Metabacillus fastidiosus]|uniref:Phage tail tube protein n=1 Tax=Metabacillus fastidiosus TaxID=1458 RepID=A0ABU6NRJ7_9BACI|nr:phage tail tube protein [Metabacillus fastidiosus]
MALDSKTVLNGSFVKVYHEGEWLMDMKGVELAEEYSYEDVPRSGTRWVGKKLVSVDGTGSCTGYKTSRRMNKLISQNSDDTQGSYVTELLFEVCDPETLELNGFIRVKEVQFESNPILSAETGSLVEQELSFTHQGTEDVEV